MTWKTELQLRDLDPAQPIEVTCKECGYGRNEWPEALMVANEDWCYLYLDELEARLCCVQRGCPGAVRVSLAKPGDTEAFVGGMA